MPREQSLVLVTCYGILCLVIVLEATRTRKVVRAGFELLVLLLSGLALHSLADFPKFSEDGRSYFGPKVSPWPMIGLVFISTLLGMGARYFFFLRGRPSWASLLKPLCVSPIVILPLLGTIQDTSTLTPIQVVSFCFLAFQNGFFWRVVFERAKANIKG